MKALRIGVMGCASVAKRLVIPAIREVQHLQLVAVASRYKHKADEYAAEFDCIPVYSYEHLLKMNEVDAIYMPLPTGLHHEWAHRALDAGKHVFMEKSLASNYIEAKTIVEKARKNNLLVMENYMFEYHSQQSAVKELIQAKIGEVRLFRASFGFPPLPSSNFRYDSKLGGGALLDAGGYVLKALSVFFKDHIPKVTSASLTYGEQGVDIAGAVSVNMMNGVGCIPAHLAFGFDHFYQCNIEIWGSKAKLSTDRTFTAGKSYLPNVKVETANGVESIVLPTDNHFQNILSIFASKCIENRDHESEYAAILKQALLQDQVRQISSTS